MTQQAISYCIFRLWYSDFHVLLGAGQVTIFSLIHPRARILLALFLLCTGPKTDFDLRHPFNSVQLFSSWSWARFFISASIIQEAIPIAGSDPVRVILPHLWPVCWQLHSPFMPLFEIRLQVIKGGPADTINTYSHGIVYHASTYFGCLNLLYKWSFCKKYISYTSE